ncbi:hypothetical protein BDZ89DRAFT_197943 [Hymenopellis radicata]|nr:hypothetical protein BDZ89DRAFT_197943 [Hymenopellis radicata]
MAFSTIYNIFNQLTHSRRSSASTGPFGLVPQELLDHIIYYLADDRASLLSCALVHPTWTSISRYHLPPLTLVVTCPFRAKELTKLLRSSREMLSSSVSGVMLVGGIPFDHARSYRQLLHALSAKGIMLRSGAVNTDPSLVGLFAQYFPALTDLKVTCASYQDITSFNNELVRWLGDNVVGTLERLELESTSFLWTCRVEEATPLIQRRRWMGGGCRGR